ncbi:transcriptional regulator [Alkalihalophilus marmarensis]|uniref:Transcriptional regulator n=1 Tax=Alkalihalophilus marmarensis DSM 21297 TaxID=1188261 RepID=U6SVY9_9BACI|nr:transcriptional regulator [Alkalihalophilus marmarensis]ERN55070.1 transcriptional regulator [Alkalihalophilus marmarensis DSM 21297]MCM3489292.1 transcriptional regulator [Alkalihalophilus marmarensis]
MSERLIRLLRIIILIQSSPGITAKELAERCETTARTIYRDLELLSAANVPITNEGYGKGYEYLGNFSVYPLDWTEKEAMAFGMLPKVIDQMTHLFPPDFYSAYEKAMATHQKEKKELQDVLQKMVSIIQMGTPAFQEEQNNYLSPVIDSILHSKTIEVVYHTQSRDVTTSRELDPYYLIPRDHRFYLIAYCHKKKRVLTFRMSRFLEVTQTNKTFDKKEFNLKQYFKNTWSIIQGQDNIRFKVLFSKEVARYIKEEELFVNPKLTENKDGSLLFEVTLNHDREFLQWLMQYGVDAEILEPVHYRDKMQEMLEGWLEKYKR